MFAEGPMLQAQRSVRCSMSRVRIPAKLPDEVLPITFAFVDELGVIFGNAFLWGMRCLPHPPDRVNKTVQGTIAVIRNVRQPMLMSLVGTLRNARSIGGDRVSVHKGLAAKRPA